MRATVAAVVRGRTWWWIAVALGAVPGVAEADTWRYSSGPLDESFNQRFRLNTRAGLWIANFDRPTRACDSVLTVASARRALRVAQTDTPTFFCPSDDSDELGLNGALEAAYRIAGPFHLTVGLELAYTVPEADQLRPQVVVGVPFGLEVTWQQWRVRPILRLNVMPVLFVTDSNRDYTLGGGGGLAVRIGQFGDLSMTIGHHRSVSLKHTAVTLGVHPFL